MPTDRLADLATMAVLAFFAVRLGSAARWSLGRQGRRRVLHIVRGLRFRHLWPVPLVLAAVAATGTLLTRLPLLSFGWWTALGGTGNPVTGTSERTDGSPLAWLVPLVFLLLLLPGLPLFAAREEELFRAGAHRWSWPRRAGMALLFGAAHAVVGIPLGFALALALGGAYFQATYLRAWHRTGDEAAALLESTRAHTAYNLAIVAVLALYVAALVAGV